MGLADIDVLTQLAFSVAEAKGVFAVLIGSGLSRAAEIPTGWEITLDLIRRVAAAQGVAEQTDWAKWYAEQSGREPDYSRLLEALAALPAERRAILHSYIEPTDEDREAGRKSPTRAHYAIADLVASGHIRVIITTNFDRLMETALRERGIEPTVVSSVDALRGAEPLTHSRCYLLKLHGDYKDARILNTDKELSTYPKQINSLLDRIFDEHGLIICGWSGEWDEALRRALLRAPNRRYAIYWAARSELRNGASELASNRGAKVITVTDADGFFCDLRDRVQTLDQARRVSPRSVELIVASAKRFLAKPEHRIELDELVASEADKLAAFITAKDAAQGNWDENDYRRRVRRFEAATETLARISGVMGRWGNGAEYGGMCDLVGALYAQAKRDWSGTVAYLHLRDYTVVLVTAAYALGLVRAQRWHTLCQFFDAQVMSQGLQAVTIADCLTPNSWDGALRDVWTHLEGLERHRTPLSDHLLDLFTEWGKSFLVPTSDMVLLFERFEVLSSLAVFGQRYDLASLQRAKREATRGEQFAYAPTGRFAWDWDNYRVLVQELKDDNAYKSALLNAGFARGSPDMVPLFIETLGHAAERMRWS